MTTTATETELEEFVRLGREVSLHWRVTLPTDPRDACRLLTIVGAYNAFEPVTVAERLETFRDRVSTLELAREYSMAVYATLPHWTHQALASSEQWGEPIDDDTTRAAANELAWELIALNASEVSYWGHGTMAGDRAGKVWRSPIYDAQRTPEPVPADVRPYQVRGWWD